MFKNYELTLDIATGDARHPLIQVNTNDLDSFKISFIITQHKEPVDLTGKTIRIAILKPDRKTVLQDCTLTDAENGKAEVILDTQAYALGGKHYAEVMVYDGLEKVAVTGRFVYNANRGILNDGTVESTNEWQSINQAIADAENILIDLRENGTGVDAQARQDLESVTAQLAQNAKELNKQTLSKFKNGVIATFIDDDGNKKFLDKWKPIADSKGIKVDVGVVTDRVDVVSAYMTTTELKSLQAEGFNIVSHSANHLDFDTLTESELRTELEKSLKFIKDNGFDHAENVLVAPHSFDASNVTIKNIIRDYYNYCFVSNGHTPNSTPIDNFNINRHLLDTQPLEQLKGHVDTAIEKGSYIVFFTHSGDDVNFPIENQQKISDLIDYIKSKNIPIMTTHEALQYKGNALYVGEITQNGLAIGKDGSNNIKSTNFKIESVGNAYSMDAPITDYPEFSSTTVKLSGGTSGADTLTGEGGTMTVIRADAHYSYATFVSVGGITTGNSKLYFRKWTGEPSTGSWGSWRQLADTQSVGSLVSEIQPPRTTGITTQEALDAILNAIKPSNTKYEYVVSLSASLSIGGGVWVVEGYQASATYAWQRATQYSNTTSKVVEKSRNLSNGTWGTWVTH